MTVMPPLNTAPQVLTALLQALGPAMPFVILRNYEGLPDDWNNDVDILIRPDDLAKAQGIVLATLRNSPYAEQACVMERLNFWSISMPCEDRTLVVDFMTSMTKCWFTYADNEAIFSACRPRHALFSVPDPLHELLLIAAKELFAYGSIRSRYHKRLAGHNKEESLKGAMSLFSNYLTKRGCRLIASALTDPNVTGRPGLRPTTVLSPRAMLAWVHKRSNRRRPLVFDISKTS
ncbi:hypothetical protein MKP05_20255 [Halomonas sp. EGI 63088]|uniref:Nucleotidyltransferase family protein n=1 Tax=Halomonas flagellata TaxID=2920385 RepID=A0ABS9RZZ2_9GAMM|nr:hypothetical protein [Halomonas flagellata]MCH4565436.1 hypothetical protein [Halomonas flagellata]